MQGRIYTVPIAFAAQSAVLDVCELVAPATGMISLLGIKLNQTTLIKDANEIIVEIVMKRAAGAYTSGSGGTTPTPVPANQGDVAASFTAEVNNDTQALAGSGTLITFDNDGWNLRSPFLWLPPERLCFNAHPTDALIVAIETDPGTSVNIGGTAYVEEIGT